MRELLNDPDTWPWLGLWASFLGTCLVIAIILIFTSCKIWHKVFHTRRGILRPFSCDFCARRWIRSNK